MHQPNLTNLRHSKSLGRLIRSAATAVAGLAPLLTFTHEATSAPANTDPFAAEMPAPPLGAGATSTGATSTKAALSAARQRVDDLQSRVERNQADLASVNQKLSQADAALAKQREALAKNEQVVASKRQAADTAKEALESARGAYDSDWKAAVNAFESSEAFRKTKADADAARAGAASREEADLKQLASTDAFKRAQDAAARTEQAMQSLAATRPSEDSDLADASQTAAEAKARLADLQTHYLGEDAQMQAARAKAEETGAAFDQLRQEFGRQLPRLPAITSARSAIDARQLAYDAAVPEVKQAEAARDGADAAVRQVTDAIKADCDTVAGLQKDANDLTGQLAAARSDLDRAQTSATTVAADQARQRAALADARQKAILAALHARQQSALAVQQTPGAVDPQTPFDNPPSGQAPLTPDQPAPLAPGQVQPGQVSGGQAPAAQVAPGQVRPGQNPPGAYVSVTSGQYAAPTVQYPVATGYIYPYNHSPFNSPVVVEQPVVVSPPVYFEGYGYPYTYSYTPYQLYIGGHGGRYFAPYHERDVVIREGGGYFDGRREAPGPRYQVREHYQSTQRVTVREGRGSASGRGGNYAHGR